MFELFLEAKRKLKNGQLPTFYANGLTDDFAILGDASAAEASGEIMRVTYEVPRKIESELASFLRSLVLIGRRNGIGLTKASNELHRLAHEFDRYTGDAFIVSGTNANVVETYDRATRCIVGCTTPRYFAEWHRSGLPLLAANEQFIRERGGRVVRFFFVRDGFQQRTPMIVDVIRDHVKAGIRALIVNTDSFGQPLMRAVLSNEKHGDLRSLECGFVDGKTFLETLYIERDRSKILIDQRRSRCQYEYTAKLQPFLTSSLGSILGASIDASNADRVTFSRLTRSAVEHLRLELERHLGVLTAA